MSDVSRFNVLGEIVEVKDSVARNVDISKAVVDILGDSNAYEFGNTGVLTDKYPNMTVHNRAVYGNGLINGFAAQVQNIDISNPPDFVIIWIGNNDVRRGTKWGIPQLSVYGSNGDYPSDTCFGALNNGLAYIKTNCPTTRIFGVIINKPSDLQWTKWRFFFGVECQIFKKWNVPVVNLNDCIGFSNFVTTQFTTYYKDSLHYNKLGCERIRDIICSAMTTGLSNTAMIEYDDVYVETTENIETDPAKWIQWAGQFLQPFDADPLRCAWAGTRSIINLGTSQRIVCTGTWYSVNLTSFRYVGLYRTLTDSTPHYYDTEDLYNNGYLHPMVALQTAGDVLPLLRQGKTLSIQQALYSTCTNLPPEDAAPSAINIVPAISSTGFLMALAWKFDGEIWLGNCASTESTITWKKASPDYAADCVAIQHQVLDSETIDVLAYARKWIGIECTGTQTSLGKITNLPPAAGTPAWSIRPSVNATGFVLLLAIGYGGIMYVGEALPAATTITWTKIK